MFNIDVYEDKFFGICDAVDFMGEPLILYYKTLTKKQLEYFILKVKVTDKYLASERIGRINTPETRLRVLRKLMPYNIKFTKDIIRDHIKMFDESIQDMMSLKRNSDNQGERAYISMRIEDVLKFKEDYKKLLQAYTTKKETSSVGGVSETDIQVAKEYPMSDLVNIDNRGFANCIFHSEDTPSMKYYPNSNTFHCFGCGVNADTIKVAQKLYGDNFINTVKRLSGK